MTSNNMTPYGLLLNDANNCLLGIVLVILALQLSKCFWSLGKQVRSTASGASIVDSRKLRSAWTTFNDTTAVAGCEDVAKEDRDESDGDEFEDFVAERAQLVGSTFVSSDHSEDEDDYKSCSDESFENGNTADAETPDQDGDDDDDYVSSDEGLENGNPIETETQEQEGNGGEEEDEHLAWRSFWRKNPWIMKNRSRNHRGEFFQRWRNSRATTNGTRPELLAGKSAPEGGSGVVHGNHMETQSSFPVADSIIDLADSKPKPKSGLRQCLPRSLFSFFRRNTSNGRRHKNDTPLLGMKSKSKSKLCSSKYSVIESDEGEIES